MLIFCTILLFPIEHVNAAENDGHKTIMIFAAHQDDEANMANAVMYSHAKRGDDVYAVIGFGSDVPGNTKDSYGLGRLKESERNLEKLGIPKGHIIYLGYQAIDMHVAQTKQNMKLNEDGAMLRTDGVTPYYTYSHEAEGFKSYHFTKYGEECLASETNLVSDIEDIIKDYQPQEIYVTNYDTHSEHMLMASMVDKAFGNIMSNSKFKDYCPRYYQSMSYQTAWATHNEDFLTAKSPSDESRNFLESTTRIRPRNTTFEWNDRVRFPVEEEMSMPDIEKNISAQAYIYGFGKRVYNPPNGTWMLGCINGDQVFWERDTRNLAYYADVTVSSNPDDASKVNNFATYYMPMTSFLAGNHPRPDIDCSEYKWSPEDSDESKTIRLTFETPQSIGSVKLYDDYRSENQITSGELLFSDGSSISVGELKNQGGATVITFEGKEQIEWVEFKIDSYVGTAGLTEFEVYGTNISRKTDFIQIYLDSVNGKGWGNKSFLYNYPMCAVEQTQSIKLGVYSYPNEEKSNGFVWELLNTAPGITLEKDGTLTVTQEAPAGDYKIRVTSKTDSTIWDEMTINVSTPWDVNGDKNCDFLDLAFVLMGMDGFYLDKADVNGDGVVDRNDVDIVWKHIIH